MRKGTQWGFFIFCQEEHAGRNRNIIGQSQIASKKGTCSGLQVFKKLVIIILLIAAWEGGAWGQNEHILLKDLVKNDPSTIILEKSRLKNLKSSRIIVSVVDSSYSYNWNADLQDWESEPAIKDFYTYNDRAQETGFSEVSFDGEFWMSSNRAVSEYDKNNNLTTYTYQNFIGDYENDLWLNNYKYIYQYNSLNQDTTIIYQIWDEKNNKWINSWKNQLEYASNGENSKTIRLEWNINDSKWDKKWCYSTYYNIDGYETSYVQQDWNMDLSVWINTYKIDYFKNLQHLDTLVSSYNYSVLLNEWINAKKESLKYNELNQQNYYLRLNWNTSSNNWENAYYYLFEYIGDTTLIIQQKWNISTSHWLNEFYYKKIYNQNSQITSDLKMFWDNNKSAWINSKITTKTYDKLFFENSNSNLSWSVPLNYWYTGEFKNLYLHYDSISSNLQNNFLKENIKFYPNPSKDYLMISVPNSKFNIEVFDQSGRKIMSKNSCINSQEINISTFLPGFYSIRISTVNTCITKSLIKKK